MGWLAIKTMTVWLLIIGFVAYAHPFLVFALFAIGATIALLFSLGHAAAQTAKHWPEISGWIVPALCYSSLIWIWPLLVLLTGAHPPW